MKQRPTDLPDDEFLDAFAASCEVKANGGYYLPPRLSPLEVWRFQEIARRLLAVEGKEQP